jgi:lipoprotein-anchoring transpeptidase ErfK/SrfK
MAAGRRRPSIGGRHRHAAGRRRRALALGAVALAAALAAAALTLRAPDAARTATAGATARGLPPPVRPAFVPGPARPLAGERYLSRWAPVQRRVPARAAPRPGAAAVATLATRTPEGTRNIVGVVGHAVDAAGRPWVRVRLAVLPNGTTGWVPRGALGGYGTVETRLDIDLRRLRATLYRAGRPVLRAPVGVGMAGWSTPRGTFYIRNRLTRYRSPTYGPVAFGTSARSPVATDWPAGGFVGIHGTDQPGLIPGRVSHGCIRLRNADILALARLMPIGTPVREF